MAPRRPAARFLAPGATAGDGHGYRTQPVRVIDPGAPADPPAVVDRVRDAASLRDEPECVGPAILDPGGDDAAYLDRLRRAAELQAARLARRELTAEDRLRELHRRAKRARVDVRRELFVMRAMLERAQRSSGRVPAALAGHFERAEARVDGVPLTPAYTASQPNLEPDRAA
jgi:hypothetical protein